MKYERFEDLPVWKSAAGLAANVFRWSSQPEFRGKGDLSNQLQRAALSISNNIAEGFERGTTAELITFLYYARGSAGEVRSMLSVLELMSEFDGLKSRISEFRSECESISRQIRAWTNSLQNSDITGQRHLNDQTRQDYDRRKKQQAFLDRQREFMLRKEAELKQAAEQRGREREESKADSEG